MGNVIDSFDVENVLGNQNETVIWNGIGDALQNMYALEVTGNGF